MVGNVGEWVADWADQANSCTNWSAGFGSDLSCFGGPGGSGRNHPGALLRGGSFLLGAGAGVFAVDSGGAPSAIAANVGFRCAR